MCVYAVYFFAAFLGAAFLGVFSFFAFGAFGFADLAAFLGDLGLAAFLGDAFLATAFFFSTFAFGLAAGFLAAASAFLAGEAAFTALGFFTGFLVFCPEALSLKEPVAPFPLVWTRDPLPTALFKYFLMKGVNRSRSTLWWAPMCFLMACREDPPRSFKAVMASTTISATLGWVGAVLGFLAAFFLGVAAAGVAAAVSSDMFSLRNLRSE